MNTFILETKELYFNYPDRTAALGGINFKVKQGDFIGILGANGSGKTTLLKILNGLLEPTIGEVYLNGENIASIKKNELFTKISTMFQNPDSQLFSPTVSEDIAFGPTNMGLPKNEIERRVECALNSVEMSACANKAIHSLSYGQKKRICLAGVLAIGPGVILLDEPTASLDPAGVCCIMQLLRDLNRDKGITMIMATHSVDLVPLFTNQVVVLNKGKIIGEGSPETVFANPQMIRDAKLRLPRIGQLFEALKKEDGFNIGSLPLTIGEARHELAKLFPFEKSTDLISDIEQNI